MSISRHMYQTTFKTKLEKKKSLFVFAANSYLQPLLRRTSRTTKKAQEWMEGKNSLLGILFVDPVKGSRIFKY